MQPLNYTLPKLNDADPGDIPYVLDIKDSIAGNLPSFINFTNSSIYINPTLTT